MSNKITNTRICTFKEDYVSNAEKAGAAKSGRQPQPIYIKGSVHAIHKNTVAKLKEKGAKMDVREFDERAAILRAKQAREN